MAINRRQLLELSVLGAGSYLLPMSSWGLSMRADPHLFLFINLDGGADFTYMFDARPLEMTKNKKQTNYTGKEPFAVRGVDGNMCYGSQAMTALKPYLSDLAIVNGVFMDKSFVGHDNLFNVLLSGNPFGGDSFIPLLNRNSTILKKAPLDGLRSGSFFDFAIKNHGGLVPLEGGGTAELVKKLNTESPIKPNSGAWNYVLDRMKKNSNSQSAFSKGAAMMSKALEQSIQLSEQLKTTQFDGASQDNPDLDFIEIFKNLGQKKSARVAALGLDDQNDLGIFDTHNVASAVQSVLAFEDRAQRLARIFKYMKATAFDAKNSLFDVTTVMVATEFGRTMRQTNVTFGESGTDHNALCNSFLFAGKGIKGGQVIGESDFRSSNEKLSGAHLERDPEQINIMAKPFDFKTQSVIQTPMSYFKEDRYMKSSSVVNTIMELFGVDKKMYHKKGQTGASYPILTSLLK